MAPQPSREVAAMERAVEVDMDRKEELILAKQLRACRVSILPRDFSLRQTAQTQPPPQQKRSLPAPPKVEQVETRSSSVALRYWQHCLLGTDLASQQCVNSTGTSSSASGDSSPDHQQHEQHLHHQQQHEQQQRQEQQQQQRSKPARTFKISVPDIRRHMKETKSLANWEEIHQEEDRERETRRFHPTAGFLSMFGKVPARPSATKPAHPLREEAPTVRPLFHQFQSQTDLRTGYSCQEGGQRQDQTELSAESGWSPTLRERRHTLGVSQLGGRRPQVVSLPKIEDDERPPPVPLLPSNRPVIVRTLSTAGQGIRRENERDEAKLNISRFITIGQVKSGEAFRQPSTPPPQNFRNQSGSLADLGSKPMGLSSSGIGPAPGLGANKIGLVSSGPVPTKIGDTVPLDSNRVCEPTMHGNSNCHALSGHSEKPLQTNQPTNDDVSSQPRERTKRDSLTVFGVLSHLQENPKSINQAEMPKLDLKPEELSISKPSALPNNLMQNHHRTEDNHQGARQTASPISKQSLLEVHSKRHERCEKVTTLENIAMRRPNHRSYEFEDKGVQCNLQPAQSFSEAGGCREGAGTFGIITSSTSIDEVGQWAKDFLLKLDQTQIDRIGMIFTARMSKSLVAELSATAVEHKNECVPQGTSTSDAKNLLPHGEHQSTDDFQGKDDIDSRQIPAIVVSPGEEESEDKKYDDDTEDDEYTRSISESFLSARSDDMKLEEKDEVEEQEDNDNDNDNQGEEEEMGEEEKREEWDEGEDWEDDEDEYTVETFDGSFSIALP